MKKLYLLTALILASSQIIVSRTPDENPSFEIAQLMIEDHQLVNPNEHLPQEIERLLNENNNETRREAIYATFDHWIIILRHSNHGDVETQNAFTRLRTLYNQFRDQTLRTAPTQAERLGELRRNINMANGRGAQPTTVIVINNQ